MIWGRNLKFIVPAVALALATALPAQAQLRSLKTGDTYEPGVWIDPDGCEHWVMDDGQRGFMSAHRTPDGRPVCRKVSLCALVMTDSYFADDSASLTRKGERDIAAYFRRGAGKSYSIAGHTDDQGSEAANADLSARRAAAVAAVARDAGAKVTKVQGMGENQPRATNETDEGRAANRRVEIICTR